MTTEKSTMKILSGASELFPKPSFFHGLIGVLGIIISVQSFADNTLQPTEKVSVVQSVLKATVAAIKVNRAGCFFNSLNLTNTQSEIVPNCYVPFLSDIRVPLVEDKKTDAGNKDVKRVVPELLIETDSLLITLTGNLNYVPSKEVNGKETHSLLSGDLKVVFCKIAADNKSCRPTSLTGRITSEAMENILNLQLKTLRVNIATNSSTGDKIVKGDCDIDQPQNSLSALSNNSANGSRRQFNRNCKIEATFPGGDTEKDVDWRVQIN